MSKLSDLLKKARASVDAQLAVQSAPVQTAISKAVESVQTEHTGIDRYGKVIHYNVEQWQFIQHVLSGTSCVLTGSAGTGKTTSTRGAIEELIRTKHIPTIGESHKHLDSQAPAIVAVSYTRRAVMNLKKAMPPELQGNCITIHKLLEYAPVFYEVEDGEGGWKKTMRFEPSRHRGNPLPDSIRTVIIDESSMCSVDLYYKVWSAFTHPERVQFIFLGDIEQLQPVFGSAILGYRLNRIPTTQLTQVYRQALESPIIRLAQRILSGNPIPAEEYESWNGSGLILHAWKKKIRDDQALKTLAAFFKQRYDAGLYDPQEDMILMPFNKACGTIELNKHIANHLARVAGEKVYEVIAGYNKHYFRVGEKILYDKEEAVIRSIERNAMYAGKWPQPASTSLNYWGHVNDSDDTSGESIPEESVEDIDSILERMASDDVEDRVHEASHIIVVYLPDSDRTIEVKTAADINSILMAYAITIHKSQGSEWRRVYLTLHHSHNTMMQRELLYTAVTRAREELYCICEPETFTKGITGQRIKGNSLAEKVEFFKGKRQAGDDPLIAEMGL